MKITKKWLNEYVKCDDMANDKIESLFTLSGTKVETIEKLLDVTNVVIAKILKIDKHPEADKLVVCKITDGDNEYQIVTGAPNVSEGDIVPLAKVGARLAGGMHIKKSKLRGVESEGMLCSYNELGLPSDFMPGLTDEGIMILPSKYEVDLGKDFLSIFDLDDVLIDFEITPNRQDCQGVKGIAREFSAISERDFNDSQKLKFSDLEKVESFPDMKLRVLDSDCRRYILAVVKDVKVKESPEWMKDRLRALGVKPINNIVDITNYVMLETGQPMHAFDKDKIASGKIVVRDSNLKETLTLLDGTVVELDSDLVISDGENPLALAGIMGGIDSGVTTDTKEIVLEAANFKRKRLRDTAKRLGLSSESLSRFEKNLPLSFSEYAISRALELISETDSGNVEYKVIDALDEKELEKQKSKELLLDAEKINAILGIEVPKSEMVDILKRLDFTVDEKDGGTYAKSPDYRVDVNLLEDLAEEIIRIHGYDKLDSTLPTFEVSDRKENVMLKLKTKSKQLLKSLGYSQIITYPFISALDIEKLDLNDDDKRNEVIELLNPLGPEYSVMRTTLVPSVLNTVQTNEARKNDDFSLFEIGKEYIGKDKISEGELPLEEEHLILARYNSKKTKKETVLNNMEYTEHPVFRLKKDLEHLMVELGIKKYNLINSGENLDSVYHSGIYAEIFIGKDRIGQIGMINPKVLSNFDIKGEVYILDIALSKLERYSVDKPIASILSKYPNIERDISILTNEDNNVIYSDIVKEIRKASRKLIQEVKLIDIYSSKELEDRKSITVRVIFNGINRTLEEEEVNKEMDKILNGLEKNLGLEIR